MAKSPAIIVQPSSLLAPFSLRLLLPAAFTHFATDVHCPFIFHPRCLTVFPTSPKYNGCDLLSHSPGTWRFVVRFHSFLQSCHNWLKVKGQSAQIKRRGLMVTLRALLNCPLNYTCSFLIQPSENTHLQEVRSVGQGLN